jgi:hypothetical protein
MAGRRFRRIAHATRSMLVRQRAQGNVNLLPADRLHLVVHVEATATAFAAAITATGGDIGPTGAGDRLVVYFDRRASLAEALQSLKTQHARVLCGLTGEQRPLDGLSLSLRTADSPDWRDWFRALSLQDLLADGEDVWVALLPVAEVVDAQRRLEDQLEDQRRRLLDSIPLSVPALPETTDWVFKKGDEAWYHKHCPDNTGGPMSMLRVKVVAVHHDDFPAVYYTVRMTLPAHGVGLAATDLVFEDEKQTDSKHLLPCRDDHELSTAVTSSTAQAQIQALLQSMQRRGSGGSAPPLLSLRLSHNNSNKVPAVVQVSATVRVQELKHFVSLVTGVAEARVRLVCSGKSLSPDTVTLEALKVPDNAKILVIG